MSPIMTDVLIIPPSEHHYSPWLSAIILRRAREEAHKLLENTRAKAAKYLYAARNRGRNKGRQEGLELARRELQIMLKLWNEKLEECLHQLSAQVEEGALALAEQIVGREIRERASAYTLWLQEALITLQDEQNLHLRCSPEQFEMMCSLTDHCTPKITVHADQSLSFSEIYIHSRLGKVGFGWKEALECAATLREK